MPRLLIVDDEPGIRSLLSIAFKRAGYDVRTAPDAAKAIEACNLEPPDAILSDIQMPGMDGHGLIRWVAAEHPEVRPILMSGFDIRCGTCPLDGTCTLLRKPFIPKDAVEAVGRVLSQ
jgi:DNA-binding NtrC family response regulator